MKCKWFWLAVPVLVSKKLEGLMNLAEVLPHLWGYSNLLLPVVLLLPLRVSHLNMGKEEPVLRFVGIQILTLVMISPHQICQISWVFKLPQGSFLCPLKLDRVSIYQHSEPSQSTLEELHLAISLSFSSWLWDFKGTFLVLGIFLKRSSCLIWAPLFSSSSWTTKVTCNRNIHWWNRVGKLFICWA